MRMYRMTCCQAAALKHNVSSGSKMPISISRNNLSLHILFLVLICHQNNFLLLVGGQVLQHLFQRYLLGLDGRVAKDPRFERLPCTHKGTYADDCLVQRVQMVIYVSTIPCARQFVQFEHICPDYFLSWVHILFFFVCLVPVSVVLNKISIFLAAQVLHSGHMWSRFKTSNS